MKYFFLTLILSFLLNPIIAQSSRNASLLAAYSMVDNGDYEKAIELLNEVILDDNTIVNAYIFRGISRQKLEQYDKSIEDFDMALKNDSLSVDVYFLKAQSLYHLEKPIKAFENTSKALSINPDHIKSILLNAKIYRAQNNYTKSIETLLDALNKKTGENYFDGWFELAENYLLNGDTTSAKSAINRALEIYPNDFKSLKLRSDISYAQKMFDSTLIDLNVVLNKKFENQEDYYLKRANIFMFQGDSLSALRDLNEVIFGKPDNSVAYIKRAWARKALYDQDGACTDIKKAKELGAKVENDLLLRFCAP